MYYFRGVLQSLVEKHFPSKTSYRVAKIVEAAQAKSRMWEELMEPEPSSSAAGGSSSSNKRKPGKK